MNILLLSQFFSTSKGGGEYVFKIISEMIARNGNTVWVITNRIMDETYSNQENVNIIFVKPDLEYEGGLPTKLSDNLRYSINAIIKGIDIIKKENIDIIHSNNFAPALSGSFLSLITGKPHITTIHDVFSLCGRRFWKLWGKQNNVSKFSIFIAPLFEKIIVRLKHDAIHTVSQASKEDLVKMGVKKPIFVITNAIESKTLIIHNKIKPFSFVYIGRLVFYKNLEVVLRAIKILKNTFPEITLNIVGNGPHRKNLEQITKDLDITPNIRFHGFVTDIKKKEILSESLALVFPSLCEGFGLVILEAFAHKKPVLVSNVRPLSDIVKHEKTGLVISAHNESEWAAMMSRIIRNPKETQCMGALAEKSLNDEYNISQMVTKIIDMYNHVKSR